MEDKILFPEIKLFGSHQDNAPQRLSKSKRRSLKKKAKGCLKKVAEAVKEAPPSSPSQPNRSFGSILEGAGMTISACTDPILSDDGMCFSSPLASLNRPSFVSGQPKDVKPMRKGKMKMVASSLSSVHGGAYGLRPRRK